MDEYGKITEQMLQEHGYIKIGRQGELLLYRTPNGNIAKFDPHKGEIVQITSLPQKGK